MDLVGNGVSTVYTLDFTLGYLRKEFIYVYSGDDYQNQLNYSWVSSSQIELDAPVPAGVSFHIRRVVPRDEPINDYEDGAILVAKNLDASFAQLLMILEEVDDGYVTLEEVLAIAGDLDMQGNRILNLPIPLSETEPVRLRELKDAVAELIQKLDNSSELVTDDLADIRDELKSMGLRVFEADTLNNYIWYENPDGSGGQFVPQNPSIYGTSHASLPDRGNSNAHPADAINWNKYGTTAAGVAPIEHEFRARDYNLLDGEDITNGLQALVDKAVELNVSWELKLGAGSFIVSDEIDLSACTKPFKITGVREGSIFKVKAFGASKKVFKMPENLPYTFEGFEFDSFEGGAERDHPICLYTPNCGRASLRDITAGSMGNTVIWCSRPFNADWQNLDLFFNGFQPIHKEVSSSVTVSVNLNSTTITASSGVFDSSDVGKMIIVVQNPSDNTAFAAKIVEYINTTTVRMDRVSTFSGSGRRFSFTAVVGSISAGSATLIMESNTFESSDVGRFVYVDGAGVGGSTLLAVVENYVSPTEVTLDRVADTAVSERQVYFTPTVYIGEDTEGNTTPINDIVIYNMLIEGFSGVGLVVKGGTHCHLKQLKTHGRAWQEFSNFGRTARPMIWSTTNRSTISGWELEFCSTWVGGGTIAINGTDPGLSIDQLTVNAACFGEHLFEFTPSSYERSSLDIGSVLTRHKLSQFKGIVYTGDNNQLRRVSAYGSIRGDNAEDEASFQLPHVIGSSRAVVPVYIDDDEVFSWKPATPAGMVTIASADSGQIQGILYFRTTNTAQTTLVTGGSALEDGSGALSGTTGADGVATVTAGDDGKLYLENRTGNGRRFYIGVLG